MFCAMYFMFKELCKIYFWRPSKWVRGTLLQKPKSLSPIPKTHIMGRKNQHPQVVLWPPKTHRGTHAHTKQCNF